MPAPVISPIDQLDQERQAMVDLNQILEQEQAHLIQADIDGLNGLVDEKNRIIARMTALANARHQSLAAAGCAANDAGMQDWLDYKGCDSAHWTALLSLAKSAREINRTNGLLISKHMLRNQQALNVLHGTAPSGSFYGPDGQATTQTGPRRRMLG